MVPPGLREHYQNRSLDDDGAAFAVAVALFEVVDALAALTALLGRRPPVEGMPGQDGGSPFQAYAAGLTAKPPRPRSTLLEDELRPSHLKKRGVANGD